VKTVFASVGTMMPFDRLVQAVDEWARDNPDVAVEIQIGKGQYEPRHAPWSRLIGIADYQSRIDAADIFVAHCGMGSIISAIEAGKPLVMLPRLKRLGEHNTDHQLATAAHFGGRRGLYCVDDGDALQAKLTALLRDGSDRPAGIAAFAEPALLQKVGDFIRGG
jgi:UDP-N-acetylglucosamine transferase subunit ALG13